MRRRLPRVVRPAGGEHANWGGAHGLERDGHHALVKRVVDDPAFASNTLHSISPTAAIFVQGLSLGLANQREARDRRLGTERADADDHRIERSGEIVDRAKPAALYQRSLGRGAVDERGSRNEITLGVESVRESGRKLDRVIAARSGSLRRPARRR